MAAAELTIEVRDDMVVVDLERTPIRVGSDDSVGRSSPRPTSDTAVVCHQDDRDTPRIGVVLGMTGREEPARQLAPA